MNHREVDWLLGRRFTSSLRVVGIGEGKGDERTVRIVVNGEKADISFGELQKLIEQMFVEDGEHRLPDERVH
jgi:hypothetical protein